MSVWIEINATFSFSHFPLLLFFLYVWTVTSHGFTVHHCSCTVHILKSIKNGSHDTIHTFKNYFAIVFSIFSNKRYPNRAYILWMTMILRFRVKKKRFRVDSVAIGMQFEREIESPWLQSHIHMCGTRITVSK